MRQFALISALWASLVIALANPVVAHETGSTHSHGINDGDNQTDPDPPDDGGVSVTVPEGTVEVQAWYRSERQLVGQPDRNVVSRRIGCVYYMPLDIAEGLGFIDRQTAINRIESAIIDTTGIPELTIMILCRFTDDDSVVAGYPIPFDPPPYDPIGPPPIIDVVELAEWTVEQITFDPTVPELSPAADQVVGIPTWLAVTSQLDYAPVSAQAGPLWVTATPTFSHVDWDLGDGSAPVRCVADAATTWNPDLGETEQSSECTYTYTENGDGPDGERLVTATVTWNISVESSGATPPAAPATQSTTAAINVRELQAVID